MFYELLIYGENVVSKYANVLWGVKKNDLESWTELKSEPRNKHKIRNDISVLSLFIFIKSYIWKGKNKVNIIPKSEQL